MAKKGRRLEDATGVVIQGVRYSLVDPSKGERILDVLTEKEYFHTEIQAADGRVSTQRVAGIGKRGDYVPFRGVSWVFAGEDGQEVVRHPKGRRTGFSPKKNAQRAEAEGQGEAATTLEEVIGS